jgi:hypothetical protein
LGRLIPEQSPEARLYAFRAAADGVESDVVVAWANKPTEISWPQGLSHYATYDYLGRGIMPRRPANLTPSPLFFVLAKGDAAKLGLQSPPSVSPGHAGSVCPVVLQLQMPAPATDLKQQAHLIPAGTPTELRLLAYNFSDAKVSGTIRVQQTPADWQITPASWTVELDSMERKPLPASIVIPASRAKADWVKLEGDFGPAGQTTLAFRLAPKGN